MGVGRSWLSRAPTAPPPPPKGTLGYVTCAQAAGSTKRRKKMGSSGAYKTRGSFVSQNMGHEDACGWATEMQSSGYAAVRQWPTLSFTHRTCKFDLNSEFIRQETVMENSRLAAQRGHSTRCVPQTTVSPPPPPPPKEHWAMSRVHRRQAVQSAEIKWARQWPIRPEVPLCHKSETRRCPWAVH